ncbi:fumarate reductase [Helicobacter enhydrae]|uniref:Fumarate reductase cytochrome b subunit n=1 Tax=Helicobacter enhydrae TaxID=222136 RepID=A0A1B1U3R5_9HELI|nr:fumarate reductase cytochrome b subunit [Helicobacter enhydrae]ANV97417.1 fumarate reductase [Helicobacter enhydrae]
MASEKAVIESYADTTSDRKKSRLPAKLDWWQSATGLFLALFMIAHMFFVSSILISPHAFDWLVGMAELDFVFGHRKPWVTSLVVLVVLSAFIAHAFLALRKFPINYKQFLKMRTHKNLMRHSDTSLWWIQAMTGFVLFFLGSAHLFVIMLSPNSPDALVGIGSVASSLRFVEQHFWILYLFLLIAVELHGSIGLYRLAVKWGWFDKWGKTPEGTRKVLQKVKMGMTIFFLTLGFLTYGAYIKYGLELSQSEVRKTSIVTEEKIEEIKIDVLEK